MYRAPDIIAALGRSQLKKFPGYFDTVRENAAVLNRRLPGLKGLVLPTEPEGHTHNWYNYTSRIDMDAIGWTGEPRPMRDALIKALNAEGLPVGVWQSFILPAMTVFRARNAYGGGCPWSCRGAGDDVAYDPDNYPVAQRHCDIHFGMTMPLRAPNGTDVAEKVADAFEKVFGNIDQVDPDRILAEARK
jgi:dTDP-4-amino-4,6-dideoxygalactose transaminase